MKEHLEQGCERCSRVVFLWQRVRQTAAAETNYTPPDDAGGIAEVYFADANLTEEPERWGSPAEVLFDSFLRPQLEGARSSSIGIRQALYRAGPFQADLLIGSEASGRNVVVTGHLRDDLGVTEMDSEISIPGHAAIVRMDCCCVKLQRRDSAFCVLPVAIGARFSNHSGCGGLRRYEMRACPVCSTRVAMPVFAWPIQGSPHQGFPSQSELALRLSHP
jgi:hypothetical protein